MKFRALLTLSLLLGASSAMLLIGLFVGNPRCETPRPADAIVVLGARVGPGGRPSLPLRYRSEKAADRYNAGLAPVVISTGGLGPYQPTESQAAANVLMSRGVPASSILQEARS